MRACVLDCPMCMHDKVSEKCTRFEKRSGTDLIQTRLQFFFFWRGCVCALGDGGIFKLIDVCPRALLAASILT